jgi:hypothetical protein
MKEFSKKNNVHTYYLNDDPPEPRFSQGMTWAEKIAFMEAFLAYKAPPRKTRKGLPRRKKKSRV